MYGLRSGPAARDAVDPYRPRVLRTRAELAVALAAAPVPAPASAAPVPVPARAAAPDQAAAPRRRAVVMTMGALHEGHLALVRAARELADQVVVTIFVNPLQFGPGEDLDRYPRDLDRDLDLLAGAGADLVFAPDPAEVYPEGEPVVRVSAGAIGQVLEGAHRPGHFDGVLTVVLKLMHLVAPQVALFGQKDAQQLMAVRRMVRDLDVPVEVVGVPIVRDTDGVALSSRNAYLDPEQRTAARALSQALEAAQQAADRGEGARAVQQVAMDRLAGQEGVVVDYVALVDPVGAQEVAADHRGPAVLALAARLGTTRLIDNATIDLEEAR